MPSPDRPYEIVPTPTPGTPEYAQMHEKHKGLLTGVFHLHKVTDTKVIDLADQVLGDMAKMSQLRRYPAETLVYPNGEDDRENYGLYVVTEGKFKEISVASVTKEYLSRDHFSIVRFKDPDIIYRTGSFPNNYALFLPDDALEEYLGEDYIRKEILTSGMLGTSFEMMRFRAERRSRGSMGIGLPLSLPYSTPLDIQTRPNLN